MRPSQDDKDWYLPYQYDISQHNVMVGPKTSKTDTFVDWNNAGFCIEYIQGESYIRPGLSDALKQYSGTIRFANTHVFRSGARTWLLSEIESSGNVTA